MFTSGTCGTNCKLCAGAKRLKKTRKKKDNEWYDIDGNIQNSRHYLDSGDISTAANGGNYFQMELKQCS